MNSICQDMTSHAGWLLVGPVVPSRGGRGLLSLGGRAFKQGEGGMPAGRHAFLVSKEFSISCQETGPMHHSGRRNVKGHPATGGPA